MSSSDQATFVWKKEKLTGSKKLVLLAIAHYVGWETGECWPSIDMVAELCNCSSRYVQKILRELEDEGHIKTIAKGGKKTATGKTNKYILVGYMDYWREVRGVKTGVNPDSPHESRGEHTAAPRVNPDSPQDMNHSSPKKGIKKDSRKNTTTTPPEHESKESTPDTPQPKSGSSSSNSNDSVQDKPTTYQLIMRELKHFTGGVNRKINIDLIDDAIATHGEQRVYAAILHAQANDTKSLKQALDQNLTRAEDIALTAHADKLLDLFKVDRNTVRDAELKRYQAWGVELQAEGLTLDDVEGLYNYVKQESIKGSWPTAFKGDAMKRRVAEFRAYQAKRQRAANTRIVPEPETELDKKVDRRLTVGGETFIPKTIMHDVPFEQPEWMKGLDLDD